MTLTLKKNASNNLEKTEMNKIKFYALLVIVLITSVCQAGHNVKIYYEQTENGYNIYADNEEFCPVSIKIDFTTQNMNVDGGNNKIYSVDALKKKQLLAKLVVSKKGKAYKFSYSSMINYGIHNIENYDIDYAYNLPFESSSSFNVNQGYNGNFSHQNENSLDFTMPVGTKIMAIREGTVIKVVEENSKSCGKEECQKFNNLIIIYHPDGTFAEYTHIKQNGSLIKVGDKIIKGQEIGYSGNVGWSTGPHLHLVVFLQNLNERITLETKFKINSGDKLEVLVEKNDYVRNY